MRYPTRDGVEIRGPLRFLIDDPIQEVYDAYCESFDEGQAAALKGLSLSDNPYEEDSWNWRQWGHGYVSVVEE